MENITFGSGYSLLTDSLKHPKFPIWILHGGDHYTTLLGFKTDILSKGAPKKNVDFCFDSSHSRYLVAIPECALTIVVFMGTQQLMVIVHRVTKKSGRPCLIPQLIFSAGKTSSSQAASDGKCKVINKDSDLTSTGRLRFFRIRSLFRLLFGMLQEIIR